MTPRPKSRVRSSVALLYASVLGVLAQTNSTIVTNLSLPDGLSGVVASQNFLYTVGSGFRIFEISNPRHPVEVTNVAVGGGGSGLDVENNYAFVLDGYPNHFGGNLIMFDISDSTRPVEVGQIPGYWFNVTASGSYVYLAAGSGPEGYWVSIYDVSNPAAPLHVGQIDTGALDIAFSVRTSGDHVYMAVNGVGLCVSDISDPATPKTVGQAGRSLAFDVELAGDFAYVVGYTNGLGIYNISNPTNPVMVKMMNPNGYAVSVTVSGNFAYAVAGDVLAIVDVSNPTNASVVFWNYVPPTVGTYAHPRLVTVSRGFAYVATQTGLRIYSLGIAYPALNITASTTNSVELTWPTPTGAFALQQNPDLNSSDWVTLTNASTVVSSHNQVSIRRPDGTMFYRLISE